MRAIAIVLALSCAAVLPGTVALAHSRPSAGALSSMAPADEYFGRFKESVLEIRNRLDAFDRASDDEMLEGGTIHALGDLWNAISDWRRKYPRDPWLPGAMRRLRRDYERAGYAFVDEGAPDVMVSVQGVVVDGESGDPVQGAVVLVARDGSRAFDAAPAGTTAGDGSFVVSGLPAGRLDLIVEPPQGSGDAPRRMRVDARRGSVDAGVIRLSPQ